MALLTCQNCGASSGATALVCQSCGALMPWNILLSGAMLALSWASFSIWTLNLVSITINNNATPTPSPEVVSIVEIPRPAPDYVPPPSPEKPPEVYTQVYTPYATDNKGKTASFVIYLLTDDYRWMLGRADMLENQQSEVSFSEPMKRLLNRAVETICLGASSEEIQAGLSREDGRIREEQRASQRAEPIARWVRAALHRPVNVRKLNIGHRDPTDQGNTPDTSEQRRVIIVLLLKMEDGVNLDQALRNAFRQERSKQPIYETILTKYSLTQGLRFHWVE